MNECSLFEKKFIANKRKTNRNNIRHTRKKTKNSMPPDMAITSFIPKTFD